MGQVLSADAGSQSGLQQYRVVRLEGQGRIPEALERREQARIRKLAGEGG